jgi:hypothetical protein
MKTLRMRVFGSALPAGYGCADTSLDARGSGNSVGRAQSNRNRVLGGWSADVHGLSSVAEFSLNDDVSEFVIGICRHGHVVSRAPK